MYRPGVPGIHDWSCLTVIRICWLHTNPDSWHMRLTWPLSNPQRTCIPQSHGYKWRHFDTDTAVCMLHPTALHGTLMSTHKFQYCECSSWVHVGCLRITICICLHLQSRSEYSQDIPVQSAYITSPHPHYNHCGYTDGGSMFRGIGIC